MLHARFSMLSCVLSLSAAGLGLAGCSSDFDACTPGACPEPSAGSAGQASAPQGESAGAAGEDAGMAATATGGATSPDARAAAAHTREVGADRGTSAPDQTPPTVVSVSPADGALGVSRDAQLVITFSEAMDEPSVQGAYTSADLPAASVSFSWNDAGTVLTLTPASNLKYATGATDADGSLAFAAQSYVYSLNGAATDLAGNALTPASYRFSTLRQASFELGAIAAQTGTWTTSAGEASGACSRHPDSNQPPSVCVGGDGAGGRSVGLLSFDLAPLPAGIVAFASATLSASSVRFGDVAPLGENDIERAAFAALDDSALSASVTESLGSFFDDAALRQSAEGVAFISAKDVTASVKDDYERRASHETRSQFRIAFGNAGPGNGKRDIELVTSSIRLSTVFLIP